MARTKRFETKNKSACKQTKLVSAPQSVVMFEPIILNLDLKVAILESIMSSEEQGALSVCNWIQDIEAEFLENLEHFKSSFEWLENKPRSRAIVEMIYKMGSGISHSDDVRDVVERSIVTFKHNFELLQRNILKLWQEFAVMFRACAFVQSHLGDECGYSDVHKLTSYNDLIGLRERFEHWKICMESEPYFKEILGLDRLTLHNGVELNIKK